MAPTLYLSRRSPPCRTVLFVAKLLNVELEEVELDMRNKAHLKPDFLKLNPRHSIPTLVDNGVSVWESRAIAQYLCNKYAPDSPLYPREPERRARVDTVLNWDLSSWGPALRNSLTMKAFRGVEPTEEQTKALTDSLAVFDALVAANGGFVAANHLTIADLSLLANSAAIFYLDYDLKDYPNVKQWFSRLEKEISFYNDFKSEAIEGLKKIIEMHKTPA